MSSQRSLWSARKLREKTAICSAPVTVRNIIVSQDDVRGEFDGKSCAHANDSGKLKTESDDALIARMLKHVRRMADIAKDYHLQDNFEGGDSSKLKNDKMNAITMLTFSEFSFYPFKERGALTLANFCEFASRLDKLASEYPVNMHFLIATMPVMANQGQVFNAALYIQTGITSSMHFFAKAIRAMGDCEYPSTSLPYFNGGSIIENFYSPRTKLFGSVMSYYVARQSNRIG